MSKKKYVIETAFKNADVQKIMQLGVDVNGRIVHWTDPIGDLEELNSDYINEHYGSLQDEAYQAGLNDAWEAVRKIALMDTKTSENVTGYFGLFRIMENLTPMQAIEKLKAYEDKRSDRIEVGDIVDRYIDGKFDSRGIYLGGNGEIWDCLFWANTLPITLAYPKGQFKKTGKHYDIASILEAMRK